MQGEAGDELEDEPPAAGRVGPGRAAGLGRRGEGCVVQGRDEERAVVLAGGGAVGEEGGVVVPGEEHGVEGDVGEFSDHGEIEEEGRGDVG